MVHKSILKHMEKELQSLEGKGGYSALGRSWGLAPAMVWRMLNEPGYWPKDKTICSHILQKAKEKGIVVRRPGRKRDLFSLDPRVLLWMLENREEVL